MEINTKEKKSYTFLKKGIDTSTAIYFEETSGEFYLLKAQNFNKSWGFSAMFLAPLSILLRNTFVDNIILAYALACMLGLGLGIISLKMLSKSYSSADLDEIKLSQKDMESCVENLKKVKQIKILLILIWLFLFAVMTVMFFDEKNYVSLISLSLLCCFLMLLLKNINFIRDNKVKKEIELKINE